jgi:hypothetical protein
MIAYSCIKMSKPNVLSVATVSAETLHGTRTEQSIHMLDFEASELPVPEPVRGCDTEAFPPPILQLTAVLRKLIVAHPIKKSPFMQSKGSLPCSHEFISRYSPELDKSSPNMYTLRVRFPF